MKGFISIMLFPRCLLLSFMVVQVQLFLYQPQPFLFVNINDTAEIQCSSKKTFLGEGVTVQWFRRREGEAPMLIKRCSDSQNRSKAACIFKGDIIALEIYNAQRNDSGVYYCSDSYITFLTFGNGSTIIVGDSYTTNTWVLPLAPSPHSLLSKGMANLVCVVHGVSNLVQISWSISGDLQKHGVTRLLKAKHGSFVFINHISVPMDIWTSGKSFTCDVKFNCSGKSVKKIARYLKASSVAPVHECKHYTVPLAAGAGLLLLLLSASLIWILCPSALGFQLRTSSPPASQEHENEMANLTVITQVGIVYTHLDFESRSHDGHTAQRSARGKRAKP